MRRRKNRNKRPYKRSFNKNRDYQDPVYVKWRKDVKERDKYRCQWPGCLSDKKLQVHHIKMWAHNPGLRFVIANGITLCSRCHKSIKGKEQDFESFFLKLLEWQMLDKIKEYNEKRRKS